LKKIGIFFLTIIVIVSGLQVLGAGDFQKQTIQFHSSFSPISFVENQDYLSILSDNIDVIDTPGSPKLPRYHKVFSFPGKIKITDISYSFSEEITQSVSNSIEPVPEIRYKSTGEQSSETVEYIQDTGIYGVDAFYPSDRIEYSIRCGLDFNGVETTFVCFDIYPICYNPLKSVIKSVDEVSLEISYKEDTNDEQKISADSYDLVIIAPNEFVSELQPLVTHKISMGVRTLLKTTEEILSEYNGRDEPEQIKYFIKDAKENMDAKYILLVGGLKSYLLGRDKDGINYGASGWHVPVRYTLIKESDEVGCISDLYYADLYRYNEDTQQWEFEDWDSNGDGVFAKWSMFVGQNDKLDLVPDIYVGRLPCRNKFELRIVRDKIINYESTSPAEKPWFNKIIGISGKNFDIWKDQPDGEYLVDRAIENMSGVTDDVVRVYASNILTGEGSIPDTEGIVTEFSKGAGFIDFEGHGNPIVWDTIKADGEYDNHDWVGGIRVDDFLDLSNGDKLPVVMVGGCHNGLYNVSILKILLTRNSHSNYYWTYTPTPLCFCWAMVVKPNGGAIASIGATGLGPASGNDPISLQGEIDLDFFYAIGHENAEKLGEAHSGAVMKYVTDNDVKQREAFTATITQLFGDPSLQFGGY
jgi:hypothetical protein